MTRDDKIVEATANSSSRIDDEIRRAPPIHYDNLEKDAFEAGYKAAVKKELEEILPAPASPAQVSEAIVEAVKPIKRWLAHLSAIGSRRLEDNEYPEINGAPKMGELRKLVAVLEAALAHPPQEWLPISDMPNNGKLILLSWKTGIGQETKKNIRDRVMIVAEARPANHRYLEDPKMGFEPLWCYAPELSPRR